MCGQSAEESARELARRIASAGAIGAAVRVQNPAGVPAELMAQIRTIFEQELATLDRATSVISCVTDAKAREVGQANKRDTAYNVAHDKTPIQTAVTPAATHSTTALQSGARRLPFFAASTLAVWLSGAD